jgi:hypothetical protein
MNKMNTTPNWITELLEAKVSAKKSELSALIKKSGISLSQAIKIDQNAPEMPKDLTVEALKPCSEYYKKNAKALRIASLNEEIGANEVSFNLNLMHCPKKFVVTDGGLTSPSGFNISEKIFVQTEIAIHMDDQPTSKNTPHSNVDLYVSNINQICKKYE